MPRNPQEPTHLQRLPTPALGQISVMLWVLNSKIKASTTLTAGVTLDVFAGSLNALKDGVAEGGFGSYLLADEPPRESGDGYLGYTFTKPSTALNTDLDQQTPVFEREIWRDMPWPNVLRWLKGVHGTAIKDTESGSDAAGSTSNTRTERFALDQYDLVPGGNFPTRVIVRKYVTAAPITGLVLERPFATPVRYRYLEMVNSLDCLHDDVIVPPLLTAETPITGFGTAESPDLSRGQLFPRTNHLTWLPHYFAAEVPAEPKNGVYETTVYEALPPPLPEAQEL